MLKPISLILASVFTTGCGADVEFAEEDGGTTFGDSTTTSPGTFPPTVTLSTSTSTTTTTTSTTTQVDTSGSSSTTATDTGGACGEVDVLFVVDNSGSMGDEQGRLDSAVPGFLDELYSITGSVDPHVMVVDVDAWVFEGCEMLCETFNECIVWEDYECGVTAPTECEDVLGAGVMFPQGDQASNEDCGFTSGGRYVDSSQPDMAAAVSCALKVGVSSSADPETPMEAMVDAIDAMGETATCNEGFLRDEAVLLIVFVTDEDDAAGDSAGEPLGWQARIVGAKGGVAEDVFVLGLFGDNDEPDAICTDVGDPTMGAESSPRLEQFVGLWDERGVWGSVCANDYSTSFDELLSAVEASCG